MRTKLALFAIIPHEEKGDEEVYWCDIGRKLCKFSLEGEESENEKYICSGDIVRTHRIDNNEKVVGILDGGNHVNIREGWTAFRPRDCEIVISHEELYPDFRFGDFIVKEIPIDYKDNIEDSYKFGYYRHSRRKRLEQDWEKAKSEN